MLAALSLGALAVGAAPALAKDHGNGHGRHDERHDGRHGDNHDRGRDRHYARDHHDDRNWGRDRDRRYAHGRHDRWDDRRHGHRAVYGYDWNRPDPRYRGYYAERYYRGGYDPIRMNRHMRIYRGYDDRYYCRRDDGTTGLIIGAALGAMLGNQLERGQSNLAATLIGGGVGGLLGREIDRGDLVCR
jgi:hypothetical protein